MILLHQWSLLTDSSTFPYGDLCPFLKHKLTNTTLMVFCNVLAWLGWSKFQRILFPVCLYLCGPQRRFLWEVWRVEVKEQPSYSSQTLLLICWPTWLLWGPPSATALPSTGPSFSAPIPRPGICVQLYEECSSFCRALTPLWAEIARTDTGFSPPLQSSSLCLWVPDWSWSPPLLSIFPSVYPVEFIL